VPVVEPYAGTAFATSSGANPQDREHDRCRFVEIFRIEPLPGALTH
jgi:hypothetical protein